MSSLDEENAYITTENHPKELSVISGNTSIRSEKINEQLQSNRPSITSNPSNIDTKNSVIPVEEQFKVSNIIENDQMNVTVNYDENLQLVLTPKEEPSVIAEALPSTKLLINHEEKTSPNLTPRREASIKSEAISLQTPFTNYEEKTEARTPNLEPTEIKVPSSVISRKSSVKSDSIHLKKSLNNHEDRTRLIQSPKREHSIRSETKQSPINNYEEQTEPILTLKRSSTAGANTNLKSDSVNLNTLINYEEATQPVLTPKREPSVRSEVISFEKNLTNYQEITEGIPTPKHSEKLLILKGLDESVLVKSSKVEPTGPETHSIVSKDERTTQPMLMKKSSVISNKNNSKSTIPNLNQAILKKISTLSVERVTHLSNKQHNGKDNKNISEGRYESDNVESQETHLPVLGSNIGEIAKMSKILTDEANALKSSIKKLSEDISMTQRELFPLKENVVDFPYHLFLLELIVNKIHMKCECFEIIDNNLVISAAFLGKDPIILYDSSYGKIETLTKIDVGKSILFAITYDKICALKDFKIALELTKQPPCSHCVTKVAETRLDYTKEFLELKDDLCKKWCKEQPTDNIVYTTSTPLMTKQFYLTHSEDDCEKIGVTEVTVRMSFLGKEITTAYSALSKPKAISLLLKEENGMTLFSCQKVEMDKERKILLNEEVLSKDKQPKKFNAKSIDNCTSELSTTSRQAMYKHSPGNINLDTPDTMKAYSEILTRMNENELIIKVPKTTRIERIGKYSQIEELCTCESIEGNESPENQMNRFEKQNVRYMYKETEKAFETNAKRKVVNVTPANCPVPVNMEKVIHPEKDVFVLRISKKTETKEKRTDLEIELLTPKAIKNTTEICNISQQCSKSEIQSKGSTKKKKKALVKKSSSKLNKKKKSKTKIFKGKKKN